MSMAREQRDAFDERLKRINKGAPNTMGEVHIGPREEVRAGQKSKTNNTIRVKRKKKNVNIGEGSNTVLVPTAFVIGALSMFAGGAMAYHFFGGGLMPIEIPVEAIQPAIPYADLIFAGLLALLFMWTFGFTNKKRKLALILGLAGVFYFEGDLIERYPNTYAAVYSEDYVASAPEPRAPGLVDRAKAELPGLMDKAEEWFPGLVERARDFAGSVSEG